VHNNYYFLRQLTDELKNVLTSTVISECYSQNKDEFIIRFETHGKPFYIKANLGPSLSILSFPGTVDRAKKNSVNLFPGIIGHRVLEIRQFNNERSFALQLEEDKYFVFKMYGNRSNALLTGNGGVSETFKSNLTNDAGIDISSLDRSIDWSYEAFVAHQHNPEKLYFTFGKIVWIYLREKGFDQKSLSEKWQQIREVLAKLENPSYYLAKVKNTWHLSLLPLEGSTAIEGTILEVANRFFYAFTHEFTLEHEKASVISTLRNKLSGSLNYYEKNFQKLTEIQSDTSYRAWADLIMANMHDLKQGLEKITLPDFYHEGKMIEIKLKKELSPQGNAALFYKKAKNQHIEIERLQQSLRLKEKEIEKLKRQIDEIQSIKDLKELRKITQGPEKKFSSEKQSQPLPYYEFEMKGYRIWVGKNAVSNDQLTLKYSHKEDLWLHAKDVAGSHVIIKYQSGKKFPKDVIERAAQLAAFNSKRKNETLCPVIVTAKKFVRKRKGDPAGTVVVEREEVIMVEPKL
jgi:predicted ribosome quality control (RQC) complex YloA/Tae2 family protein